ELFGRHPGKTVHLVWHGDDQPAEEVGQDLGQLDVDAGPALPILHHLEYRAVEPSSSLNIAAGLRDTPELPRTEERLPGRALRTPRTQREPETAGSTAEGLGVAGMAQQHQAGPEEGEADPGRALPPCPGQRRPRRAGYGPEGCIPLAQTSQTGSGGAR